MSDAPQVNRYTFSYAGKGMWDVYVNGVRKRRAGTMFVRMWAGVFLDGSGLDKVTFETVDAAPSALLAPDK